MRFASKTRTLNYGDRRLRTPLLLPSFSSRAPLKKVGAPLGQDEINTYLAQIGEDVVGPALISAFDLHYEHIKMPEDRALSFGASPTFIDSGGYENLTVSKNDEGISEEQYAAVLKNWPNDLPIVAVSFDCEDQSLGNQIQSALSLPVADNSGKLLLLKPDQGNGKGLSPVISQIPNEVEALRQLSAIGLTEKEAGETFVQRVARIEELRSSLNACGLVDMPIHVFGGLDPLRTYYYFLAGADIFDGTSWLRFAFEKGQAIYLDAYASGKYPDMNIQEAEWLIRRQNLADIVQMQMRMRSFLASGHLGDLSLDSGLLWKLFPHDDEGAIAQLPAKSG